MMPRLGVDRGGEMIEVLLERDDILAVNKPEGTPTIPGGGWTGSSALSEAEATAGGKLYVVHRLDKETSGVVVFARNPETHRFLNERFSRREVRKTYLALVHGLIAARKRESYTRCASSARAAWEPILGGKRASPGMRFLSTSVTIPWLWHIHTRAGATRCGPTCTASAIQSSAILNMRAGDAQPDSRA